jgi:hypothetical protein
LIVPEADVTVEFGHPRISSKTDHVAKKPLEDVERSEVNSRRTELLDDIKVKLKIREKKCTL